MGKLIPIRRFRAERSEPGLLLEHEGFDSGGGGSEISTEPGLWPIGALLWVFSLARVTHAVLGHEPFDTEPTVALLCLLGLPGCYWWFRRNAR